METPAIAKKRDMTAPKTAFVQWLLDPDHQPRTQQDLAKVLGVDAATLSDWKQDEFVLALLRRANEMLEPVWARALATLSKIATDADHINCVSAIRELGKLLGKYPSEKVDLNIVDRVAYATPTALRDVSASLERIN